jgi:hypothetical protein
VVCFLFIVPQACLQPCAGEGCPLLDSFAAFVKNVEAMFNSRRFASLNEVGLIFSCFLDLFTPLLPLQMRKYCISSSQSSQCEWVEMAKQTARSALIEHLLNLLVDALPSLSFSVPAVAIKVESDAAQPAPVCKVERLELVTVSDGAAPSQPFPLPFFAACVDAILCPVCKKVIQDLEKRSEHIMQLVNELPFADYKGNLPAPHTLQELKEASERGEYKAYPEVRPPPRSKHPCPPPRSKHPCPPPADVIGSF